MKKQSNLFQFFSSSSQPKSKPSLPSDPLPSPLHITFKQEPPSQLKLEEAPSKIPPEYAPESFEEEDLLTFKTLKKRKLDFPEDSLSKENSAPQNSHPQVKKPANPVKKPNKSSISSKNDETFFINVDQENKQSDLNLDEFDDKTPAWALKPLCQDKRNRYCNDPDYDPTTLHIPPEEKKKMTPTMKQFWEIKSENFDKVIFFKLGKFYELFYEDAYIGNKYLDLNWMGRKMHVGFPEKALERYANSLVESGFKVAVIEQVETPKQMEERLRISRSSGKKDDKTIQRELVEIFTKGTYVSTSEVDSKFLLCLRVGCGNELGFCLLENLSNFVTIGHLLDDANHTKLKTLLMQIRPAEIVYDAENLSKELLKILQKSTISPVFSPVNNAQNKWHAGIAYNYIEKTFGSQQHWPKNLLYFFEKTMIRDLVFSSLSGLFSYLDQVLILEKVLISARFSKYDEKIGLSSSMILDSQALQHLEVFESNSGLRSEKGGTLFSFLDKTVSPFGKRMLKRWVCAPCLHAGKIRRRLDAIEDLQRASALREKFRKGMKELPDLERNCAKMYQYSIKTKKIVYFEDVSANRLREFKTLLQNLVKAENLLIELQNSKELFRSARLKELLTFSEEKDAVNNDFQDIYIEDEEEEAGEIQIKGLLPRIGEMVKELLDMIIWEGKDRNIPTPGLGLIENYDKNRELKKKIEEKLKDYLCGIRKRFSDSSIDFCHAKFRYELEIPEKLVKGLKKPEDFEFTSARAGFQRFLTEDIKEIVKELEEIEEELKKDLKTFAEDVFRYFRDNYNSLDSFTAILSEIDCLCALSLISFNSDGVMCRPEIHPLSPENGAFIELLDARHPSLCSMGIDFIPNDIFLGNCAQKPEERKRNLMLLTGPNMGGKSTVLRMTSVLVILAQIGCYVPAKSCRLSLIDRIFTRLGASDKLMEGKSTFFIEMEETLNIVNSGSKNSLAILDELGRGTSTFDGVSLAYSVLKYLVENLGCRTIFATHYHVLLEEFRMYAEIEFFHMAAIIDEKMEKVVFLYKLKEGQCSSSFGLNVAKVFNFKRFLRFFGFLMVFWGFLRFFRFCKFFAFFGFFRVFAGFLKVFYRFLW